MRGKTLTKLEEQARDFYIKHRHKTNVPYDKYMYRVKQGYNFRDSIMIEGRINVVMKRKRKKNKPKNFNKRAKIKGTEKYKHYLRIAIANNINEDLFYSRLINSKMPMERAATEPKRGMRIPENYARLARKNNIDRKLFRHRIVTLGWSIEKAATTPISQRKEEFAGYTYEHVKQLNENEEHDKVIKQINFYKEKGLVVPKKYIKYANEHNIQIA